MKFKIWRQLSIVFISCWLTGCATHAFLLTHKPNKQAKIAVVGNFSPWVYVTRLGTTDYNSTTLNRRIRAFFPNHFLVRWVKSELVARGYQHSFIVLQKPNVNLSNQLVFDKNTPYKVSAAYQYYLQAVLRGYPKATEIMLIVPGVKVLNLGYGNHISLPGVGLYQKEILFRYGDTVYGAFKIYLINAKTYAIMGATRGGFAQQVPWQRVDWLHMREGISPQVLALIEHVFRQRMPGVLKRQLTWWGF